MGTVRYCEYCHKQCEDVDSVWCNRCLEKDAAFVQGWKDFWYFKDGGIGPGWFWVAILAVAALYWFGYPR